MAGENWIRFEGYDGRLDPGYRGEYATPGIRYPYVERTRTWDIVRIQGEPVGGVYPRGTFTVLSRGHDMMKKAHDEAAGYRLHFKRCQGVGKCLDIGHPGGPRRSTTQALLSDQTEIAEEPVEPAPAVPEEEEQASQPEVSATSPPPVLSGTDWVDALRPAGPTTERVVGHATLLRIVPLRFELWVGPRLTMAEDCNKRGGRVTGDRGELSCAEVEIVKRLRAAGWAAAWVQSFKCGRLSWGSYIADVADLPPSVRAIQRVAGEAGGHPDVLAWWGERIVAIESKGPGDALKPSQIAWFAKAIDAGVDRSDIGVVEWRPQ